MKKLKQFCAATTLLFVLSLPALAGDIHTNAVDPPPPPPAPMTATMPDDVATDGTQSPSESETFVSEITLSFLQLLAMI